MVHTGRSDRGGGRVNWGFALYCALLFAGLLMSAHNHGKPKTGKENFWTSASASFLMLIIILWAMHWKVK